VADQPTQDGVKPAAPPAPAGPNVAELASRIEARRPQDVPESEWRAHRVAQGHMVVVRSHFKSIYLVPMAIISVICGVWMAVATGGNVVNPAEQETATTIGLVWTVAFTLYMSMFIFEWSRTWTYVLLSSVVALVFLGYAVNSDRFPVWRTIRDALTATQFTQSAASYFFFAAFFGFCAFLSWIRTRLNYVVIEHNELEFNRNALFGDKERISLVNPRIEVRVVDMLEYFHPFYRAGQIIIHAPNRTLVLDNVLHIRSIERVLSRLTGTLSVKVEKS
jgi:hypothetical protein